MSSFVPSVNVVAFAPGTDPLVKDEYVVYSAHFDHDGIGEPVKGDSIWNGADDNASGAVGLLAIGRAFTEKPGRRSALFVWHGAEEKGLLGSQWFVSHPTVPKEAMIVNLNADMISRNDPQKIFLRGVTPLHRGSEDLAEMAINANEKTARFEIDTTLDSPDHPEQIFFRSDQISYAQAGIPALLFTSGLHDAYHTSEDESDGIEISKLARVAQWMYAAGLAVANAENRPALDPSFNVSP